MDIETPNTIAGSNLDYFFPNDLISDLGRSITGVSYKVRFIPEPVLHSPTSKFPNERYFMVNCNNLHLPLAQAAQV